MTTPRILTPTRRAFLAAQRRIVLATVSTDGQPRLVPICFALDEGDVLWTPIDEKPKRSGDPAALARVRDIAERPGVALLADRWSEDWSDLAWLRLYGQATLMPAAGPDGIERRTAISRLRERYPQYAGHRLEDLPIIRVAVERARDWGLGEGATRPRSGDPGGSAP